MLAPGEPSARDKDGQVTWWVPCFPDMTTLWPRTASALSRLGEPPPRPGHLRILARKSRGQSAGEQGLIRPHRVPQGYGNQLILPVPDLDRTSYFLVLGANPMASNGSLMTAPDLPRRLKALRARGGRLVVIDPRRTETADVADEHHFIRPGTAALFLLGFLHTLFSAPSTSLGPAGERVRVRGRVESERV